MRYLRRFFPSIVRFGTKQYLMEEGKTKTCNQNSHIVLLPSTATARMTYITPRRLTAPPHYSDGSTHTPDV